MAVFQVSLIIISYIRVKTQDGFHVKSLYLEREEFECRNIIPSIIIVTASRSVSIVSVKARALKRAGWIVYAGEAMELF